MAIGLVGCGLNGKTVAVIDDEKVSESLYRIFLWSAQKDLESIMPSIWNMASIDGKTPEEFTKESALNSVTFYIAASNKADEMKVKLKKEEKNLIKENAKDYLKINKDFVENYNIKEKDVVSFYTYGILSEKVLHQLGSTYIPTEEEIELKMLEANVGPKATISHVLINNINELGERIPVDKDQAAKLQAEEVLKKALAGEEMTELAKMYSDDMTSVENDGKYTVTKGQLEENMEEVIFEKCPVGEVYPEVIETSFGYEIVKVESVENVSEEVRAEVIEGIQVSFADEELTEMSKSLNVKKMETYESVHIMSLEE